MAAPGPVPDHIGRYRIEAVLGRGAMGIIYRAHDPAIDRPVAIKLVRADLLDGADRTDYIARFQREAQAAGRCAHPNVVAIYDFALHEENPYLAMEYIDGVTLQHLLARPGGFTPAEIVSLGGQMLDGLAAAHALGVVHRDIKPANIMLTARGQVKVTDFGISRLDTSNLTGPGDVIGTPSYMSPEQCRGGATDARCDLFSVAVVLYELVTGAKPFPGRSQHEVWHKLLNEDPIDSITLRPDAPAALHAVLQRGLRKDQAARFQTAGAMASALRADEPQTADALELSAGTDATIVLPRAGMTLPELGLKFDLDNTAMSAIERRLAQYVGPIARLMIRKAVAEADTLEKLSEKLAVDVPNPVDRDSFREEFRSQLTASLTRSGMSSARTSSSESRNSISAADLATVGDELAHYVGPIARLLVKRAAPGCTSVPQLRERLAENVAVGDKARFLRTS